MIKTIAGWGNFPKIKAEILSLNNQLAVNDTIQSYDSIVARGNGRSYGDSSLNKKIVDTTGQCYFKEFDPKTGILDVEAGVLLADIIEIFVPKGWFLQITPGTKFITVGGAIASDVHGKNHHLEGCFSESVESFEILQQDGRAALCSRSLNPELFAATCGGQGLTGVILSARIKLKKIRSQFVETVNIKAQNLKEMFGLFEENKGMQYSVAWIDCTARGKNIGRGHITFANFCNDGDLNYKPRHQISLPFFMPAFCLNAFTLKLFNFFYFHRQIKKQRTAKSTIDSFFYPLDFIQGWNKAYGKAGFVQFQCVLPEKNSAVGLMKILELIAESGRGSFLAVLKLLGDENDNLLSFPMKGYTLALDFKMEPDLEQLLTKLDKEVNKYEGRIYLSKDARINKKDFEKGYAKIDQFRQFRINNNLKEKFSSLQSLRLDL